MQTPETPAAVPHPDTFRVWVRLALAALDLTPAGVSRACGLGRNALGAFVTTPGRDITLSNAHVISCKIHEIARVRGVALPALEGGAND